MKRTLLLAGLMGLAVSAYADPGDIWVSNGMNSRHDDRSKHYRENNTGVGVEYTLTDDTAIYAGHYENSLNHPSNYIGYAWTPARLLGAKVGFLTGLVSGYGSAPIVAPFPMATWEYGRFGVNLFTAPGVVTAIQLKVKVN